MKNELDWPRMREIVPVSTSGDIQKRFEAFHRRNPHVLEVVESLAWAMWLQGVRRWGMKGIFEVLRWRYAMQTQGEQYKLNNVFTAFYARVVAARHRPLAHFFQVRRQRTNYVIDWGALNLDPPPAP